MLLRVIDKAESLKSIEEMESQSIKALEQVASLSYEIDVLKNEVRDADLQILMLAVINTEDDDIDPKS